MLSNQKLKAFIPTLEPEMARLFYTDILGFKLLSEDEYASELDANGTLLRITTVPELTPHPFTILGWDVDHIASIIQSLVSKGVVFQKYDFLEQDSMGIWTAPGGAQVAWFKDPDGNILSLTQY